MQVMALGLGFNKTFTIGLQRGSDGGVFPCNARLAQLDPLHLRPLIGLSKVADGPGAAVPPGGGIDHGNGARTDLWSMRTGVPELGEPVSGLWQHVRRASNRDRAHRSASYRTLGGDPVPQACTPRARYRPRAAAHFAGPLDRLTLTLLRAPSALQHRQPGLA